MRHAKSSWSDASLEDHDRPLNKRGRRDAPRIAQELHDREWIPDQIRVSTSKRTLETLELMEAISDNSTIETIDVTGAKVSGSGSSQITVNPSSTLDSSTEYYVLIDATAFDDSSSNSYAGISSTTALSFTTADVQNPTLSSSTPTDNATAVALDANIVLNFSEAVDAESGNITIKKTSEIRKILR